MDSLPEDKVGLLGGELYSKSEVLSLGHAGPQKKPRWFAVLRLCIAGILLVPILMGLGKKCKGKC